jgi:formate dehydrogenase major subunit
MIAQRVKNTRDASFEADYARTKAIAAFGGAAHDNEECSLMRKLYTGLGLVQIEHQARI